MTKSNSGTSGPLPAADALPAPVEEAINQHQARSEHLVARIQLAVVLTFSLLYSLSPKAFSADVPFEPVPWVLGAYFLFTLAHLRASWRGLPSDAFTHLSVVVDMALIYLLIWSFHLQYQQPPSFYLKVPTLLYVFIFIALRTLRLEVRFILNAGAAAALGWLLMLAYVVFNDTPSAMITRDYVRYLTSNSVLLGAEFDKIITIVIVTLVLALATRRAHQLLVQSVVETRAAASLAHFVPEQVAEELAQSDSPPMAGHARTYEATVLFVDIVGFTRLSEPLSPAETVATLNAYFSTLEECLAGHGGTINQFQGDAILASFDRPEGTWSTADQAVAAALDILRLTRQRRFNGQLLNCRIGINSGELMGGYMGSRSRLIYTVHGDVVNVAARLEALNKALDTQVLVSAATRARCHPGRFAFIPCEDQLLRGRRQPLEVFTLQWPEPPHDAPADGASR